MLRPLWQSLHDHHVRVAPHLRQLGEVRRADASWAVRAELYEEWLAEPDAFVMLAEDGGHAVGYALVHMRGPEESWQTGERIAELETLAVLPDYRGCGIGTRLIEGAYARLRGLRIAQLGVSVISSNADALRFYERLGLLPFCVSYLGNIPDAPQGPPGP